MMRPPLTLKIVEIFASLQGEGLRQGEPTIFVRLAGCNFRCSFCDTKKAWRGGQEKKIEEIIAEILNEHKKLPTLWVCLTGGEPLLQPLRPLARAIKEAGFYLQIETNGSLKPSVLADWWTVSPKPPDFYLHPEFKKKAKEIKLVVTRELNLEIIRRFRRLVPEKTPIILQPQSARRWSEKKALFLIKAGCQHQIKNLRLMIQLHRQLQIP
ncbi:MAG: 7-carboxy-7-deazaguanine synthase QueE [Candidatus Aminicenantes bacterium]|nr:7-carboxy-7-deazaguanine synthase QueE [Candidatus Aminicenantes bacterium]